MTPADALGRMLGPDLVEALRSEIRREVELALVTREEEKRWMTLHETARYLGLSVKAVQQRRARGTLPTRKDNGRVLVDRRLLDKQIEGGK